LLGGKVLISSAPQSQWVPVIGYNTVADEYLIVWHYRRFVTDKDLYGQRVSGAGALIDNPGTTTDETNPAVNFAISTAPEIQEYAAIAFDEGRNKFPVVWYDYRDASGMVNANIYGQRVANDGRLLGGNFSIATAAGHQKYLRLPTDVETTTS